MHGAWCIGSTVLSVKVFGSREGGGGGGGIVQGGGRDRDKWKDPFCTLPFSSWAGLSYR